MASLFGAVMSCSLLPFVLPDQIQSQAFYRSGFPPSCTLLLEQNVQHLIVRDNSSHLGGCSYDEQREMQGLGRRGGVFALGANVCFGAALRGVSFFLLSWQWRTKWNIFTLDLIRASLCAFWVFIVCKCIGSLNHYAIVINLLYCESSK